MDAATWAVVVARSGNGAKSRLAPVLAPADRQRLSLAMLSDVLGSCAVARARRVLAGTVAIVDGSEAFGIAADSGSLARLDPDRGDMNAAVARGISTAARHGASSVVVLPGDVPAVTVGDLEALIDTAGTQTRAVIVAASRDGQGTNALLLRPPDTIAPSFGPPSVERHLQLGRSAGAYVRAIHRPGLALDVDTPADLAALADAPVGQATTDLLVELALSGTLIH